MAGFVLFAIPVTYVLSVYREIGIASALALDLSGYFRRGVRDLAQSARKVGYDPIDSWVDETTRVLLRITQAHAQYPIIHYFHSPNPSQALPVQLGYPIEYLREVERKESEPQEKAGASPSLDALRATMETHLAENASLDRQHERILRYYLYRPTDAHRTSGG